MTTINNSTVTKIAKDVSIRWAHLDEPKDTPFVGPARWEVQMYTTDEAKATEWLDLGLPVKESNDEFTVNLYQNSVSSSGKPMRKPAVVDQEAKDTIDPATIGNGSLAHIRFYQYAYNRGGRSGVASRLSGVMIQELVEYTPVDMDTWDL